MYVESHVITCGYYLLYLQHFSVDHKTSYKYWVSGQGSQQTKNKYSHFRLLDLKNALNSFAGYVIYKYLMSRFCRGGPIFQVVIFKAKSFFSVVGKCQQWYLVSCRHVVKEVAILERKVDKTTNVRAMSLLPGLYECFCVDYYAKSLKD